MKILAACIAVLIVSLLLTGLFFDNLRSGAKITKIKRVALVGDSITEFSMYPEFLRSLLEPNYFVGEFGATSTTAMIRTHNPYINQNKFQRAKEFLPDIVVIMLGTNDAHVNLSQVLHNFASDYKMIVREFQSLESKPKIYLVTPPPILTNTLGLSNENLVEGVIPSIEQVAIELNLPIIDIYGELKDHSSVLPDGVHPNNEGANLIANKVYEAIIGDS
jgi:hypothetical protein